MVARYRAGGAVPLALAPPHIAARSHDAAVAPHILAVDTEDLGVTTGTLGLVDEVWSLFVLFISGTLSDWLGRRLLIVIGYINVAIALVLFPNGVDVYPDLLLFRLVYAQGGAILATSLTALLADLINKESLGNVRLHSSFLHI